MKVQDLSLNIVVNVRFFGTPLQICKMKTMHDFEVKALSMVNIYQSLIEKFLKTKFANYTVKVQDLSLHIVVNARPQFLT